MCVHVVFHDTWITIYVDLSLDHDSFFLCQDPVGKGIRYDGEPFAFLVPFFTGYTPPLILLFIMHLIQCLKLLSGNSNRTSLMT